MLMCCFCERLFANPEVLLNHIQFGGHGLNFKTYPCKQPNCGSSLSSFYSFKHHIKRAHAYHENDHLDRLAILNEARHNVEADLVEAAPVHEVHYVEVAEPDLSLEYFVNTFYANIQMYIAQLYANPTTNRKLVDTVLCGTGELFGHTIKLLKNSVLDLLSKCESDDENYGDLITKVEQMFQVLENPFQDMSSEHRRFRDLEESGFLIKPEPFEIGTTDDYEKVGGVVQLVRNPVYGQFIPLRRVLQKFLKVPGMFNKVLNHYNLLVNDQSGVISNFVQGDLWKSIVDDSKICLPLNLEFDDYEPDNALGSHRTEHSLGGLYASIPCLPEGMQSLLENIFLFCLFESKYRKEFGNEITFHLVIEELKYLHN